jgi:hypothetical protein
MIFGTVARYKINSQKSIVHLYTSNEQSKNKVKKTIFMMALKNKTLKNKLNTRILKYVH